MDIALSYQEKGSGEPLILLHGNGEDSSYFRHQIAHFQDRYRVIALDTRGHGKSPRGSAPFTIRQFARDLYDFMETRKIAEAVLLGFSDGANIAMRFAMEHPERVKALIPILVPLFISAFRRADELATAMECRCYHGGEGRTKMKLLRYGRNDYIAFLLGIVLLAVIFTLVHFGL